MNWLSPILPGIFPRSWLQAFRNTGIWKFSPSRCHTCQFRVFSPSKSPSALQSPSVPGHVTNSWIILDHFGSFLHWGRTDIALKSPKSSLWKAWIKSWLCLWDKALHCPLESLMGGQGRMRPFPKLCSSSGTSQGIGIPLGTHSIELLTPCGCREETQRLSREDWANLSMKKCFQEKEKSDCSRN